MNRKKLGLAIAAAIGMALVVLAFVAAPHACEWGLGAYFWCGVAALVALAVLPFAVSMSTSRWVSLGWAAGLLALGAGAWVLGMAASNMRILCRLF